MTCDPLPSLGLTRRQFCIAPLGMVMASGVGAEPDLWRAWCELYLRDGQVMDLGQGFSHSEGQGYGLLLAQAFGDRAAFDTIEAWTARYLAIRADRLMAWKWVAGAQDNIADWHNATDGDLFRAWALLRAERDSGWTGYQGTAMAIAKDIADLCLCPDPRAPQEWILQPGAEALATPARVLFNPSYILPRALRELGLAGQDMRLVRAADHGETLLAELAAGAWLPNWTTVTPKGMVPSAEHSDDWGYDALRIPLYLCWSGAAQHPAVTLARKLMARADLAGHVLVEAARDHRKTLQSDRHGFQAIKALTRCQPPPEPRLEGDYYADTLLLLAMIALRESGCTF